MPAGKGRGVGGGGGIRTPGGLAPTTVFKTVAINHSATPPKPESGTRLAREPYRRMKMFPDQMVSLIHMLVFKTGALNHSATLPNLEIVQLLGRTVSTALLPIRQQLSARLFMAALITTSTAATASPCMFGTKWI